MQHRYGINGIDPDTMNDDVGTPGTANKRAPGTTPGRRGKD
jgi:hypothetical protein